MSGKLDGKVAIVTGAGGGLGGAISRHLVDDGARVLVTDVNGAAAETAAAELGDNAAAFTLDVGDPDSWNSAVAAARGAFGEPTLLANNAGFATVGPATELTMEEVERTIRVNQIGPWLGMRALIPVMAAHGGGAIVNIASIDGKIGTPGLSHYVGTKHALIGITKSVAIEVAELNIRVNAVCPGGMATEIVRGIGMSDDRLAEVMNATVPMKRAGGVLEVGAAFLLTDDASYVTGADWVVDGGLTAGAHLVD